MLKRMMWVVLALAMVTALGAPAMAGEETGSIRVVLRLEDRAAQGGTVTLYKVGCPLGPDYGLTEAFGSGIIRQEDAMSPVLAKWLAETTEALGEEKPVDAEGSAVFDGLQEGLYLLVQRGASPGFHPMEPMLVTVPCQYQYHVTAYPKLESQENPSTGQSPAPFLGAIGVVLSSAGLIVCGRKRKRYI